ncbi:hypothetical protein BDN70DRAFT_407397 [Pholiota conissans]|uniref:Uncharacterized protein n=1 Tax=Pholiota conissans TaxID=109636 RepID=A0A9P5YSI0_9AGAR|nr:hypothetical protein BDN70DRAFT_407397 [Pholiota conissans]
MSTVPLDIVGVIIDQLAEDFDDEDAETFASVKSMSLVCRDYLPFCRKRIFASIVLTSCRFEPWKGEGLISQLHELLSTTPEIAGYIRDLKYYIGKEDFKDPTFTTQTLRQVTCLTSLFIHHSSDDSRLGFTWWNPLRPALHYVLQLPSLREFHISNVNNFFLYDLAPCINLETFSCLHSTAWPVRPIDLPSSSIRLRALIIGVDCASIMRRMCTEKCLDGSPFIDFSKLTDLSVTLSTAIQVEASQMLGNLCTELVKVSLYLLEPSLNWVGLANMLLPSRNTLKCICLETVFSGGEGDDPLQGLVDELKRLGNDNIIEEIVLRIHIFNRNYDFNRGDRWGSFDKLFAEFKWPMLRSVALTISFTISKGYFLEELRNLPQTHDQFPWLSSNKSLVFKFDVKGM